MRKETILTKILSLPVGQKSADLFKRMKGFELLGTKEHPSDFSLIRAEYINTRIRLLALLFSVLTPLWIPVDFLILPDGTFLSMMLARICLSVSLLTLWFRTSFTHSLHRARQRLIILMVIPSVFHLMTQVILGDHLESQHLASYTFLPFLIIAIHCVFPLTLKEGSLLAFLTIFALSVDEMIHGRFLTLQSLNTLWLLGVIMGIAVWAQLSQLHMQLKLFEQATTDSLTGLLNRRSFMHQAETELNRSERYARPLSIALLDLDHFKNVNDTHGHQAGDQVLVHFSELLREELRSTDLIGRFGGEEFIIVLPETPVHEAEKVLERILDNCRNQAVRYDGGVVSYTASAGLGELVSDIRSSLHAVDVALYQAKEQGRDRLQKVPEQNQPEMNKYNQL